MTSKQHILRLYDQALNDCHRDVSTILSNTAAAFSLACKAFSERDSDLAGRIIADDELIDGLNHKIKEQAITMLATFSPVSVDLKLILSLMKLSGSIERLGDHAAHISKHIIKFDTYEPMEDSSLIVPFFNVIAKRLEKLEKAFREKDQELIAEYFHADSSRDCPVSRLIEKLAASSEDERIFIPALAELIFIAKRLEYAWLLLQSIEEEMILHKS